MGLTETANASAGADVVKVWQFVLPYRAVVGKIVFQISTLSVGAFASVGIYNAGGTNLLVHTGAVSTTDAEIKNISLASSVTLEPGVYLFAWTHSDATIRMRGWVSSNTNQGFLIQNGDRVGDAANASSSGVLPATTGAITVFARNIAAAYFEP